MFMGTVQLRDLACSYESMNLAVSSLWSIYQHLLFLNVHELLSGINHLHFRIIKFNYFLWELWSLVKLKRPS